MKAERVTEEKWELLENRETGTPWKRGRARCEEGDGRGLWPLVWRGRGVQGTTPSKHEAKSGKE